MENEQVPPVQGTFQGIPAAPVATYVQLPQQKAKRSLFKRLISLLGCLVVIFSIIMNFVLMIALSVAMATSDFAELGQTVLQSGDDKQVVAVYSISGVIDDRAAGDFAKFYRTAKKSTKIKAIVLRVDSPGGGIAASDEIYKMITDLKSGGKPIVVSMGGLAASGGYYVSAPADYIMAEPTTITGSIGVVMQLMNLEGTMDKLGIKPITITSSNAQLWKAQGSPFKPLSKRERENFIAMLNNMQTRFETVVSTGRPKLVKKKETYKDEITVDGKTQQVTKTDVSPFNGQIYDTQAAIKIGLVDEQGYLNNAWEKAATLAKLGNPKVVSFSKRQGLFAELADGMTNVNKISQQAGEPKFLMQWGVN